MDYVGECETPKEFFRWAGLSLVAATLRDKVKVKCTAREEVPLNLFVVLLGPSGCGKEFAMTTALRLASGVNAVNAYQGKLTGQALTDMLCGEKSSPGVRKNALLKEGEIPAENHAIWLVMEELYRCMGKGDLAETLLGELTALSNVRGELQHHDMTRTHGLREVDRACINWLGGSTKEWFIKSISSVEQIGGGLFARLFVPNYKRDRSEEAKSHPYPVIPENHEEIEARLRWRLQQYAALDSERDGLITLTEEADELYKDWYLRTQAPKDMDESHIVYPLFDKRTKPFFKFMGLESIMRHDFGTGAEPIPYPYLIEAEDVRKAEEWFNEMIACATRAYGVMIETPMAALCEKIRTFIQKAGPEGVKRSLINARYGRRDRGHNIEDVNKALDILKRSKDVASQLNDDLWVWRGEA